MMELRKRGSSFVPFYPQSFLVPADFEQLQKEWKNRSFWIVKPVASSRGRGIRVVSSKEIGPPRKSGHLVQEYIWNPYLITGRKFDLRLYILVSSICPFRIYIHESGLARFATRQYDVSISPTDRRMHLTNFAVNRVDTSFVSCQESESIENSKWSLPFLFRYLEVEGIDVVALKKDIESVAVTTILAGMIEIRDFHRRYVTHRHTCYELYGIDILLDSDLKPYVMEINISPSLNSKDSKLDFSLKFPLMLDLLRVARIIRCNAKLNNPCPGVFLMDKAYRSSLTHQRRVDVESQGVDPWLAPVFADFAIVRDFVEEKQRLGGFHRVFPKRTPGNAYDHLFSSKKYEDLVLGAWVQKSASDRHRALLRSWPSYASAMSQLHAQSPRQRAPTAR
jgi:tubulin polyglutamylase TTLL4